MTQVMDMEALADYIASKIVDKMAKRCAEEVVRAMDRREKGKIESLIDDDQIAHVNYSLETMGYDK